MECDLRTFETATDVSNQQRVAEVVRKYLGTNLRPCPKWFPADFVSSGEKVYIEIRCRNCYKGQYNNFLISGKKYIELLRLKFDELNPTVYLAVAWTDAVGLIEVDFKTVKLVPFHRNQSVGTYQADVMISIPISDFKIIASGLQLEKSRNWIG